MTATSLTDEHEPPYVDKLIDLADIMEILVRGGPDAIAGAICLALDVEDDAGES